MAMARWWVCCLVMGMVVGCGASARSSRGPGAAVADQADMAQRIGGIWQLQSYVPESSLSPAMLLGMQSERIVVRIAGGRIQSLNRALRFDRAFRLADVQGDSFKLFVRDDTGVEYESACDLDEAGRLLFYTLTAPWRGRGVLVREGLGMAR